MANAQASAKHVVRIVKLICRNVDRAIGQYEFIQAGNAKAVVNSFEEGKGQAPILIRSAMLESLALGLNRMVESAGTDRDTLQRVFELLDKQEVFAEVTKRGDEDRLLAAKAEWGRLRRAKVLPKLRHLRDHYMAHTISKKWGTKPNPEFGETMRIAKRVFKLVENLAAGCRADMASETAARRVWRTHSREFWRRVSRGSQCP